MIGQLEVSRAEVLLQQSSVSSPSSVNVEDCGNNGRRVEEHISIGTKGGKRQVAK